MSITREQLSAFLGEETRVGRLATASADGAPHVVPIWFVERDGALLVHTQADSTKARNIAANGRFSLAVDKDTHPYKGVSIQGTARLAGDDEIAWNPLIHELARLYCPPEMADGFGDYIASMPGEHVTLVLEPRSWEFWDYAS